MKNGRDGSEREDENVVSLAQARKQSAKGSKRGTAQQDRGEPRPTTRQWLTGAFFMMLAIGGVLALAAPLLRAAGIVGD
jgi:hypothetical protein